MWYYKKRCKDDLVLASRIREVAQTQVRYDCERIFTLLWREGWKDNHKRVYRMYRAKRLNFRSIRPKRNQAGAHRMDRAPVSRLHECWSMDFVVDQLFNGKKFWCLTKVDKYSKKCMAIYMNQDIKGDQAVAVMESLRIENKALPKKIRVDNGSEFISKVLDKLAYDISVIRDFSKLGKPTDNAYIESFNGSFQDECLNTNWFLSLQDTSEKIEAWGMEYNTFRPYSSLNGLTQQELFETSNLSQFFTLVIAKK